MDRARGTYVTVIVGKCDDSLGGGVTSRLLQM